MLFDSFDAAGEDSAKLVIEFGLLLFKAIESTLILYIRAVFEVVAFGPRPVDPSITDLLPRFCTARSIKWPAECRRAFFTLVCSSMTSSA